MRIASSALLTAALAALVSSTTANAAVSVVNSNTLTTYSNTLNFDESGTPTAPTTVSKTFWLASKGVTISPDDTTNVSLVAGSAFTGGDVTQMINDGDGFTIKLSQPVTSFSASVWSGAGNVSAFSGGGVYVFVSTGPTNYGPPDYFDQGYNAAHNSTNFPDFNITATGTTTFDTISIENRSDFTGSGIYIDNISFTPAAVPEPTSLGLIGMGAASLLGRRRRRV